MSVQLQGGPPMRGAQGSPRPSQPFSTASAAPSFLPGPRSSSGQARAETGRQPMECVIRNAPGTGRGPEAAPLPGGLGLRAQPGSRWLLRTRPAAPRPLAADTSLRPQGRPRPSRIPGVCAFECW